MKINFLSNIFTRIKYYIDKKIAVHRAKKLAIQMNFNYWPAFIENREVDKVAYIVAEKVCNRIINKTVKYIMGKYCRNSYNTYEIWDYEGKFGISPNDVSTCWKTYVLNTNIPVEYCPEFKMAIQILFSFGKETEFVIHNKMELIELLRYYKGCEIIRNRNDKINNYSTNEIISIGSKK